MEKTCLVGGKARDSASLTKHESTNMMSLDITLSTQIAAVSTFTSSRVKLDVGLIEALEGTTTPPLAFIKSSRITIHLSFFLVQSK